MLRTKKDVDRHVQDIFRKLPDENEKTLRCFKIAELYYHVGDFESARRYLSRYVEVRKEAKAHKLMGQIFEALGQKEDALIQYKFSFELNAKQEELILKICELLADPEVGIDINHTRYWVERAENLFPQSKVVFRLKEKILSIEKPTNNEEDLEKLILAELKIRPTDVHLRAKLIKHYVDKNKFDDAYKHVTEIEAISFHRDSLLWYQALCDLFLKLKSTKQMNWNFWILYISSLERYAALAIKEQGCSIKKSSEALQAVYNFDQHLFEAKSQSFTSYPSLTEKIFEHMWGQMHFHIACLLLLNTKYEQSSWPEASRLCAPLLLTAAHIKPIDLTASWAMHLESPIKKQLQIWYREGSYRCSQAGHILQDYAKGNQKKLISSIEKFCTGSWRDRVYQRIFVGRIYQKTRTSYFTNNNTLCPPLRLVSHSELKRYDEVAEEVWPCSLHHQVWPAIKSRNSSTLHSIKHEGPQPNLSSHLFPDLQFSVYNANQASPVSLCRLDIDAFLNAAALCASAVDEDMQRNNFFNPDRLPTLPADLTNPLCTEEQEKWWTAVCRMYRKENADDSGEIRQTVQRGLEVIRCIGNHGLHPVILVHLARIFQHRAKLLREKNNEHSDISALENRSELYWAAVVPLLERLQNNQTIRTLHTKLFEYIGKDMNNMELTHAIEEGKLLLAQKLVKDELYEQAIEALQTLKCPEASFEQGKIYKKLADESINSMPKENVTSEMRSQHTIILSKARNCFYLTLDRLRSPDADPKHPLNAELSAYITEVENELKRIDPDTIYNDRNQNDCDDVSNESFSSAHSDEQAIVTNSMPVLNNSYSQTPSRNVRRTTRQASTPRHQNNDILDISRNRIEARPSPERLDAQIRQLVFSIESLKEQSREQHRTMISKLDELIKISARAKETPKPVRAPQPTVNQHLEDELYNIYNDEDYSFNSTPLPNAAPGGNRATPASLSQNLYAQRHPYSPLIFPPMTPALQNFYQGGPPMPFTDPSSYPGLYQAATAAAAAAAAGQPTVPPLYRSGIDPLPLSLQMSENIVQQGLFSQRLAEYAQTQQQPLPAQQQQTNQLGFWRLHPGESSKNESKLVFVPITEASVPEVPASVLKESSVSTSTTTTATTAPSRKAPPVNVVITTSDTLPTTAPSVQPTLSVTIPAQHRLGVLSTGQTQEVNNVPHDYQISMPSQPTIPTTVNLPPLSTTLTVSSPIAKTNVTDQQNSSIVSTGSRHSDVKEVEHDPIPDFAPIIPLPDEVPVTTGEEDEEELFCARAKLFRFADKEWKERGIGNVKLLKNVEGKIRLLMRREQVHKICANHMLRRDMELQPMPNTDRAYMWVANDFADEEIKLEKLCIKFKTAEEATNFKENFNKAKDSLPLESADTSSSSIANWTSKTESQKDKPINIKPSLSSTTTSSTLSVSSFTTGNNQTESKKTEEQPTKPSPFANFSFVKSSDTNTTKPSATTFSFGTPTTTASTGISTPSLFNQDPSKSIFKQVFTPAEFTKKNEKSNIEDGETIILDQSVNLKHSNSLTKLRINKGNGVVKVLFQKTSARIRFLINTEDNSKTIFNEVISPTVTLNIQGQIVSWSVESTSNKGIFDTYEIEFKNRDQALLFQKTVTGYQQKSAKPSSKLTNSIAPEQKPLSELFKPAAGSWECKECYTRNSATATHCVACQGPSPTAAVPIAPAVIAKTPQSVSKNLFDQFKPAPGSWECKDCYTRNNAGAATCVACQAPAPAGSATSAVSATSVGVTNKPISEMFKPVGIFSSSSWECNKCKVSNTQSNQYCVACDAPKDPSMPPKPSTGGGFGLKAPDNKTTFSFGIPQAHQQSAAKDLTTSSSNFNFSFSSKPSENAVSQPINIFGNKSANSSGFNFGMQPPKTPPPSSTEGGPFTFGSPGKSFDFQFQAKSPTVKSPERAETSDEEVVEESEDVYFPPVIPLPDKVDVKTGEENEDVLYSHRAKLFKFDTSTKEWKERGLGDIKLLRHVETKKLRLVMRRDQVLKLCLNHAMSSTIEITAKDDKTWMWSAGDYSEGEIEYIQFACRFKTPEIAGEFKQAIDDACHSTSSDSSSSTKTDSSNDVQIVYELKVTPEEKAEALKLKLPENFYAYKYKEDCPGCRGCRETDEPLFKSNDKPSTTKSSGPIIVKANDTATLPSVTTASQFSFNAFGTPSTTTTPQTGLKTTFGTTSTNIFGSGKSALNGGNTAKTTSFVFGQPGAKPDSQETGLENLKVCSPSTKQQTSTAIAATTASTNIFSGFGTSSPATTTSPSTNIFSGFGGTNTFGKTSLFGGSPKVPSTTAFNTPLFSAPSTTTPSTTTDQNVFGTNKPGFGSWTFSSPNSTSNAPTSKNMFGGNIFGGSAATATTSAPISSSNSLFGGGSTITTKPVFGGTASTTATPIFGTTAPNTTVTPTFGSLAPSTTATSTFGSLAPSTTATSTFGSLAPSTTATSTFGSLAASTTAAPTFGSLATSTTTASIFGSTTAPLATPIFGAKSPLATPFFGSTVTTTSPSSIFSSITTTATAPVSSSSVSSTLTTSSLFGNKPFSSSKPLFDGQTTVKPLFGSTVPQTDSETSQAGLNAKPTTTTATITPVTTTAPVFFGTSSVFSPKPAFDNNTTIAPAAGVFENAKNKPAEENSKDESGVSFLPTENLLTFSALAAQTKPDQKPAFKADPNFTFDGAGSSVFNAKSKKDEKKSASKNTSIKKDKDTSKDDEDGEGDEENGDEHDPYFEPIVPLPDAIEVRTGEEDEEKVFCQRAKLYRYDNNTKEWKERGTGEMKLLHHAQHGTYRLLLRREQVYKVVCNLLLTTELEFHELNTSNRAWVWAAMNYADPENPEVEQLAVKFKSPELAQEFKKAIDKAQQDLATNKSQAVAEPTSYNSEDNHSEDPEYGNQEEYDDEDEGEDEEGEEEDEEDDDDDDCHVKMFEKPGGLSTQAEGELDWQDFGDVNVKAIYDSDIYGVRIIVENDNKELVSDTVISIETKMECYDEECIWTAIDYALNPPNRRSLKVVFPTVMTALEMYNVFQEGKECATNADIRE